MASLGERDVLSDGTALYQLVLEYSFIQSESQAPGHVTPRWPGLNSILYEASFHGQFYMILDRSNSVVQTVWM